MSEKGNREFIRGSVGSLIRAAGRRVAAGDRDELASLLHLQNVLSDAIDDAAHALHYQHGYSWEEIARSCGMTKQAAHKRWADRPTPAAASSAPMVAGIEQTLPMRARPSRRSPRR